MAIENYGLREMILKAVDAAFTVYLHTGNPGVTGITNRVAFHNLAEQKYFRRISWLDYSCFAGTRGGNG